MDHQQLFLQASVLQLLVIHHPLQENCNCKESKLPVQDRPLTVENAHQLSLGVQTHSEPSGPFAEDTFSSAGPYVGLNFL